MPQSQVRHILKRNGKTRRVSEEQWRKKQGLPGHGSRIFMDKFPREHVVSRSRSGIRGAARVFASNFVN